MRTSDFPTCHRDILSSRRSRGGEGAEMESHLLGDRWIVRRAVEVQQADSRDNGRIAALQKRARRLQRQAMVRV